jgi:hypothetical protein
VSLAAAIAVAVLVAAGCGGSQQTAAPATTAQQPKTSSAGSSTASGSGSKVAVSSRRCIQVGDDLVQKIRNQIVLDKAQLTNVSAVASGGSPGFYFVSARVQGGGGKGVATWAVRGLDANGPIYSVDSFAALVSDYGASTAQHPLLNLTAPGAFKSRVCADGPSVSHGSPAPFPGSNGGVAG